MKEVNNLAENIPQNIPDDQLTSDQLPVYARRNSSGHYTWSGVQYASVTTIIGPYGGQHLMMWYAKMAVEEVALGFERAAEGLISQSEAIERACDVHARKNAAVRYRDHRGAIGTLTHHAIYERVFGVRETDLREYLEANAYKFGLAHPEPMENGRSYARQLAIEAEPYVLGAFDWLETEKPEFEAIGQEAVVINPAEMYAGTIDAVAKIKGRRYALDFKTSTSIQEFKFRMQIEAYRRAAFIGLVPSGEEFLMPDTDAVGVLHIKPLGASELLTYEPSDDHYRAFLALRDVYYIESGIKAPARERRSVNAAARAAKAAAKADPCPFGQQLAQPFAPQPLASKPVAPEEVPF